MSYEQTQNVEHNKKLHQLRQEVAILQERMNLLSNQVRGKGVATTTTSSSNHTHNNPVEDDAYGSDWNGDITNAPSQNAVYDKIETLLSDVDGGDATSF